ncbi:MAG: hypothetical protein PG981_001090 [Wolbachia endosymbiont of Ctenocephalides orientis wCori]|nr:MAG: hypothetical protein PG981_001090 [Wolbachia endosymbiont of Ctenocephalides orientis wCori]
MSKLKRSPIEMFNLSTYFTKIHTSFSVEGNSIEFSCDSNVDEYVRNLRSATKNRHFDDDNAMDNFFKLKSFPFSSSNVKQCDGKKGRFMVPIDDDVLYNFRQHCIQEVERWVRLKLTHRLIGDKIRPTEMTKVVKEYIRQGINKDVEVFIRDRIEKAVSKEEKNKIVEQKEKMVEVLVKRKMEAITVEEQEAIVRETVEAKVKEIEVDLEGIVANDEKMKYEYAKELDDFINSVCKTRGTRKGDYYKISANKLIFLEKMHSDDFIKQVKSYTASQISKDFCKTLGEEDPKIKTIKCAFSNIVSNISEVPIDEVAINDEYITFTMKTPEKHINSKQAEEINEALKKSGFYNEDLLIYVRVNKAMDKQSVNEPAYAIPVKQFADFIPTLIKKLSIEYNGNGYEYVIPINELQLKEACNSHTKILPSECATSPHLTVQATVQRSKSSLEGKPHKEVSGGLSKVMSDKNLEGQNKEGHLVVNGMSDSLYSTRSSGYCSAASVSQPDTPQQSTTDVKSDQALPTVAEAQIEKSISSTSLSGKSTPSQGHNKNKTMLHLKRMLQQLHELSGDHTSEAPLTELKNTNSKPAKGLCNTL